VRYAEVLGADGNIDRSNLGTARSEDVYTYKGDPNGEMYEPRFTYHGFQYFEVSNWLGVPVLGSVDVRVVRADVQAIGNMAFSHPALNQLHRVVLWTESANLHSMPTACENRDERTGWTGDAWLSSEGALLFYDSVTIYSKWLQDIIDLQDAEGAIPDVVPFAGSGPGHRPSDPAWGTALPQLAWMLYRYYGDTRALKQSYEALVKYVSFLERQHNTTGLEQFYSYYGDWTALEESPGALVSSSYYYHDVQILQAVSTVLHKQPEVLILHLC
jgi:alpha-L-rhamnosidase